MAAGVIQPRSQAAADRFKLCCMRYQVLLDQLRAESTAGTGLPTVEPRCAGRGAATLLRRLLASDARGGAGLAGSGASAATGFEACFLREVDRLRLFVSGSLEEQWLTLTDAFSQLRGLAAEAAQAGEAGAAGLPAGQPPAPAAARLAALRRALDAAGEFLVLLDGFLQHNSAACAQLAQMYDAQCGGAAATEAPQAGEKEQQYQQYLAAAQAALLGGLQLETLLVRLSDCYEWCRLIEEGEGALAGEAGATWTPPDIFERVTRKFWLRPADIVRFKAAVVKHLPLLIMGEGPTDGGSTGEAGLPFLRDHQQTGDSSDINSVYFDSDGLDCYHTRLAKEDMASVVRLRWYGERSMSPDQAVYVEQKVHRDKSTGEASYKQRAPLEQRCMADFTSGAVLADAGSGSSSRAAFLQGAQQFLVQGGQAPLLRTCYRRAAFQQATDNQVRISLDTELRMVREAGATRAPGDWCRDMRAPVGPADAVSFPYAVVEIKLQAEPPEWVEGLLDTGLLLPAPKFSKFLHGAAVLFQGRCRDLPRWFLEDEGQGGVARPATWEEMEGPAEEYVQMGTAWLFPRASPELGTRSEQEQPPPTPQPGQSDTTPAPAPAKVSQGDRPCPRPSPLHSQASNPKDSSGEESRDLEAGMPVADPANGMPGKAAGGRGGRWFRALRGGGGDASDKAEKGRNPQRAQVRAKVEPKTFFANERTFLQWLQISVLIMMTSTSMMSGSGLLGSVGVGGGAAGGAAGGACDTRCIASKLSGAIIAPVALLFMAYALYMYRKRTQQMLRRESVRYDDQRGPVVLVVLLLACFLLAYVLAMVWIF